MSEQSVDTAYAGTAVPTRATGVTRAATPARSAPVPAAAYQAEHTNHARRWSTRYQLVLVVLDICAALGAAGLALVTGADDGSVESAWPLLAALPPSWVVVLALGRAYEARSLGSGPTEFERTLRAFFHITAFAAFALYAAHQPLPRGFVLVVLPAMLALSTLGRCLARRALRVLRASGHAVVDVLAIGDAAAVRDFAGQLERDPSAGMRVVGACLPGGAAGGAGLGAAAGVRRFHDVDRVAEAVTACGADAVAVLSSSLGPDRLRWISWQLENQDTCLLVSPGLTEIAGRRLHIEQICGLPLLSVAQPTFGGVRRVVKGAFDRCLALVGLVLALPLLLVIAALVRCTSTGPALFRQTRVGKDGRAFRMIKFRTMVAGAELRIPELVARNDTAGGVLFKMHDDPRVTRIGRTLRRYSLDELPQLVNVLCGSMSLVGPRPPLPAEVARYATKDRRRLLVKPGLTGLWQVSGRSDLSWEESVRLDLRYVENWSLTADLMILWKTVFAVVKRSGAY